MSNNDLGKAESSLRTPQFELQKIGNINPDELTGYFAGYALLNEKSKSIEIYSDPLVLYRHDIEPKDCCCKIGWLKSCDIETFNFINKFHNGITLCWGRVNRPESKNADVVHIALGFDSDSINVIKEILRISLESICDDLNPKKSSERYFGLLENYRKIEDLLKQINIPEDFHYPYPLLMVDEISTFFEEKEEWTNLIKLDEDYGDLISVLPPHLKERTVRRVKKAKNKLRSI